MILRVFRGKTSSSVSHRMHGINVYFVKINDRMLYLLILFFLKFELACKKKKGQFQLFQTFISSCTYLCTEYTEHAMHTFSTIIFLHNVAQNHYKNCTCTHGVNIIVFNVPHVRKLYQNKLHQNINWLWYKEQNALISLKPIHPMHLGCSSVLVWATYCSIAMWQLHIDK